MAIPSSVFLNTAGKGMAEVTGTSTLDTLELLEQVNGLNCVTCDVDSVTAFSLNTGREATSTGTQD